MDFKILLNHTARHMKTLFSNISHIFFTFSFSLIAEIFDVNQTLLLGLQNGRHTYNWQIEIYDFVLRLFHSPSPPFANCAFRSEARFSYSMLKECHCLPHI